MAFGFVSLDGEGHCGILQLVEPGRINLWSCTSFHPLDSGGFMLESRYCGFGRVCLVFF